MKIALIRTIIFAVLCALAGILIFKGFDYQWVWGVLLGASLIGFADGFLDFMEARSERR